MKKLLLLLILVILSCACVHGLSTQGIEISQSQVDKIVPINQYVQDELVFRNNGATLKRLTFSLEGKISQLIRIDKVYTDIGVGGESRLDVMMFGMELGDYVGNLTIKELDLKIPLRIKVYDPDLTPVSSLYMEIETEKETLHPGDLLRYRIQVYNFLLDSLYNVTLNHRVSLLSNDSKTDLFENTSEVIEVKTIETLDKTMLIPKNATEGNYVIQIDATYLNLNSSASKLFMITLPIYDRQLFGVRLWIYCAAAAGLVFLIAIARRYKARKEKNKKYHTPVLASLLPKPGSRSAYIGKIAESEHRTYLDIDQLTTHAIVAGSTGGGKTVAAQDIVEEALLKGIAVVVFDPTAQWSGMLRKCESDKLLALYPKFGMKPGDARSFNGNVRAITDPRTMIDLKKYLKPGEIQIFTVNTLDPKGIDTFVANTVSQVFHANFPEAPELKYLFVYDEVHRLLPKFGGSGEGFVQIERACREFRKWGIGMLLISQVLADFVGQIKANINTELQMRTRDEGDLKRIATKYGKDLLQSLVKASIGTGMVQNAEYNRGKPYFVSFRPIMHSVRRLGDDVLQTYNKYNDLIDDYEYQLEQLDKEKLDVFDMKLELKLALDKLKAGSFNMVDIYLDGLRPKLEKEWARLGKKPKKLQVNLINNDSLKEDILKAEQERSKLAQTETAVGKEKEKELLFKKTVKPFTFDNGAMISNIQELLDALLSMDDQIFKIHVNDEKNEVCSWIEGIDKELSGKIKNLKDRDKLIKILTEEKKKKRMYVEPDTPDMKAAEAPTAKETPSEKNNGDRGISELIGETETLLKKGRKEEAKNMYAEISRLYSSLGMDEKKEYHQACVSIYQQLR